MVSRRQRGGRLPYVTEQQSAYSTQCLDDAMPSAILYPRQTIWTCAALLPAHQLLPKPPTICAVIRSGSAEGNVPGQQLHLWQQLRPSGARQGQ